MGPLGGGLLPQMSEYFDFVRGDEDQSVVEAAIRFNASHKEITTVLMGFSNIEEVEQGVKFGEKISSLTEARVEELRGKLSKNMNQLCTSCQYCDDCPQGIPIPRYMMAFNSSILKGSEKASINELRRSFAKRSG
jgi:predicted aldo/keto reductase-like oxidoreductase